MTPSPLEIVTRTSDIDFLDLPWHEPLRSWSGPRLVDVARGVSRHVVRFVDYDGQVFAVKETTPSLALSEYELLRALEQRSLPVVEAIGVVRNRATPVATGGPDAVEETEGRPTGGALITRHLAYSLPYRYLFHRRPVVDLQNRLIDALAVLLVRLHIEGFFWGDCSLSNALFRRDAGALTAYLVDAETGTLVDKRLSDGQRRHDLSIAVENVGGELLDLDAAGRLSDAFTESDPGAITDELIVRYERLWDEIRREDIVSIGDHRHLAQSTRRLNALGFDVAEFRVRTTDDRRHVSVVPRVVEVGHHQRRLHQLTGVVCDENQARRLLNDIEEHRATLVQQRGANVPDALAAYDWLTARYEPTLAAIPPELRGRLADAEIFHQLLEHRWYLSEEAGHDIGMEGAVTHYIDEVLASSKNEATLIRSSSDEDPTDLLRSTSD